MSTPPYFVRPHTAIPPCPTAMPPDTVSGGAPPSSQGLFLLVLPVADSAALALPMAQLLFNVSHAARAAAITLSSGPPPRPAVCVPVVWPGPEASGT